MALFVADSGNSTIRRITLDGTVSTLCGSPGKQGSADGKGSAASFTNLRGIAYSPNGTLFVTESNHRVIRQVTFDGTVTTVCGSPTAWAGPTDGKGSDARFNFPQGLAFSSDGTLFVADSSNRTI